MIFFCAGTHSTTFEGLCPKLGFVVYFFFLQHEISVNMFSLSLHCIWAKKVFSSSCFQGNYELRQNITTISVNHSFCPLESLLLPNSLRYQNMNRTLLSEIIWVMFLAHHCLPKVAKNCQKSQKSIFEQLTKWAQTIRAWMRWAWLAWMLAKDSHTLKCSRGWSSKFGNDKW